MAVLLYAIFTGGEVQAGAHLRDRISPSVISNPSALSWSPEVRTILEPRGPKEGGGGVT